MLKKLGIAAVAVAVSYFYGLHSGKQSVARKYDKALIEYQQKQELVRLEWEKKEYDLYQESIVKDTVIATLDADANSLQQTIRNQRAELTESAANLYAAYERTSDVLEACVSEYQSMARDADGTVNALRVGQSWYKVHIKK